MYLVCHFDTCGEEYHNCGGDFFATAYKKKESHSNLERGTQVHTLSVWFFCFPHKPAASIFMWPSHAATPQSTSWTPLWWQRHKADSLKILQSKFVALDERLAQVQLQNDQILWKIDKEERCLLQLISCNRSLGSLLQLRPMLQSNCNTDTFFYSHSYSD